MGFFSSLFEIEFRVVGERAKEYCTNHSIQDGEYYLIEKFQLNKDEFVPYRNALLVQLFNLCYLAGVRNTENNPESTFEISQTFFQNRTCEYYEELTEPDKIKMKCVFMATSSYIHVEEAAEWLYCKTSHNEMSYLSADEQSEFSEFVNNHYVNGVTNFFKANARKLLK